MVEQIETVRNVVQELAVDEDPVATGLVRAQSIPIAALILAEAIMDGPAGISLAAAAVFDGQAAEGQRPAVRRESRPDVTVPPHAAIGAERDVLHRGAAQPAGVDAAGQAMDVEILELEIADPHGDQAVLAPLAEGKRIALAVDGRIGMVRDA